VGSVVSQVQVNAVGDFEVQDIDEGIRNDDVELDVAINRTNAVGDDGLFVNRHAGVIDDGEDRVEHDVAQAEDGRIAVSIGADVVHRQAGTRVDVPDLFVAFGTIEVESTTLQEGADHAAHGG